MGVWGGGGYFETTFLTVSSVWLSHTALQFQLSFSAAVAKDVVRPRRRDLSEANSLVSCVSSWSLNREKHAVEDSGCYLNFAYLKCCT